MNNGGKQQNMGATNDKPQMARDRDRNRDKKKRMMTTITMGKMEHPPHADKQLLIGWMAGAPGPYDNKRDNNNNKPILLVNFLQ
jgi:hypothetical protein